MNKRQIERAARLYSLAVIAKMDLGGCDTEEQEVVISRAIQRAVDGLWSAGVDPRQVSSMAACIDVAKGVRPATRSE